VRRLIALVLFGWALFVGRVACADDVWTDANIVTGLDLSGSIEARDAQIQIDGLALAVRSPQIMAAIRSGHHERIGFAVFVWADGNYPVLSSWRLIASPKEALAASQEITERLRAIIGSDALIKLGALTDLSGALDYGGEMLRTAPFATSRRIVNIIGNGVDNVGEGAPPARDRLVAQGVTINGVSLGYDRTIYEYFKREVIGGPEAFVLMANEPESLVEVLARKFMIEIVFNLEAAGQPLR
jgi:Ca-activated chloride channel homolog